MTVTSSFDYFIFIFYFFPLCPTFFFSLAPSFPRCSNFESQLKSRYHLCFFPFLSVHHSLSPALSLSLPSLPRQPIQLRKL